VTSSMTTARTSTLPKWQGMDARKATRLLVIWGKYDLIRHFGAEAYQRMSER